MNPPVRSSSKRWMLLATLGVVGSALLFLVFSSFNDALVYFYTPTEIQQQTATLTGKKIRIGGMVQAGSLTRTPGTLKIAFLVTDGKQQIPVRYEGMTPDLFREGQGVVVEGVWQPGEVFTANTILAKHSEDYVPVDMTAEGVKKAQESIIKSLK